MTELIPPTTLDRIMTYFRQLVRAEFPRLNFLGLYEYSVQSVSSDGTTYELLPTDDTLSLPGSKGVPLRLSCATATLTEGSLCVVAFINGDPGKACIVSGAPTPTNQTIDASATLKLGPSATLVQLAQGGDFVALASKVETELNAIKTAHNTHVHVLAISAAAGSGGTGTAAPPGITYTPGPVASSTVSTS